MKKITALVVVLFISLLSNLAVADIAQEAKDLSEQYLQALKSKDREEIRAAWEKIDNNANVKMYIKKNMPAVHESLAMQHIAFQLEELKYKYFGSAQEGFESRQLSEVKSVSSNTQERSNSDLDVGQANQRKVVNQQRVNNFSNRDRISNESATRSFPNQGRISNQQNIRTRLKNAR